MENIDLPIEEEGAAVGGADGEVGGRWAISIDQWFLLRKLLFRTL